MPTTAPLSPPCGGQLAGALSGTLPSPVSQDAFLSSEDQKGGPGWGAQQARPRGRRTPSQHLNACRCHGGRSPGSGSGEATETWEERTGIDFAPT